VTKYLISFPSPAMVVSEEEFPDVVRDSHAVVAEAKAAGVWVFGGGLDEAVPTVKVAADGTVTEGSYPQTADIWGGYTVLELPNRAEAERWAAKIAAGCRCDQELREFMYDPES
jgi:hypothetical protein